MLYVLNIKMWRRLRSRSVHNFGTCIWRTAAQWRLRDHIRVSTQEKSELDFDPKKLLIQNSPREDSFLRPYTNQQQPTVHPTTLCSPFPPNHTLLTPPHTHFSHPPPHPHTLDENFLLLSSPNIPLRVCADTREGVYLTGV